MDEYVDVRIQWFRDKCQLVDKPSNGIKLFTQIKFPEEGDKIPQWTAEIIITRSINEKLCYGNLRYLFEQAPKHLLEKGKVFIVFDGPLEVAKGEVLTIFNVSS